MHPISRTWRDDLVVRAEGHDRIRIGPSDRPGRREGIELRGHHASFGLTVEVLQVDAPDLPERLYLRRQRRARRER